MRFPRHARIFRGQLDATPFAIVLFLLVMFLLLAAHLYKPGIQVRLPAADDLPGTDSPTVNVALDAAGRLFHRNELVTPIELENRLRTEVSRIGQPLTLVVHADKKATHEQLIELSLLARKAGITDALWATLPRMVDPATRPAPPP